MMAKKEGTLADFIRATIRDRGPVTFHWFMEQALYHPAHGYYSSGRCAIGRNGDYFTNVSVGSVFGRLMAKQFSEIWRQLGSPHNFGIVEQGAHDGNFARDVLEAARAEAPEFFSALFYQIVEPFSVLHDRQRKKLDSFKQKIRWRASLEELEPFVGVHFSNELLDAMPIHLVTAKDKGWREKYVTIAGDDFEFIDGPLSSERLHLHVERLPMPSAKYETEINLGALDWIERVAAKLERGVILTVDYGHAREEFYVPERTTGTLRVVAQHRIISSALENVGCVDITAHVEWTSLTERAEQRGLSLAGFTDQNHFLTALATILPNELSERDRRALQTLLHPGLLGRTYQFLALAKNTPPDMQLTGFKFAREPRALLGLSPR